MRDIIFSPAKESTVIPHFLPFSFSGVSMCLTRFSHRPFQLPEIAGKMKYFAKTLQSGKSTVHLHSGTVLNHSFSWCYPMWLEKSEQGHPCAQLNDAQVSSCVPMPCGFLKVLRLDLQIKSNVTCQSRRVVSTERIMYSRLHIFILLMSQTRYSCTQQKASQPQNQR